jgi:hypothetical protein
MAAPQAPRDRPMLAPAKKAALVNELMKARSAVRSAKFAGRQIEQAATHHAVAGEMVFRLEGPSAYGEFS